MKRKLIRATLWFLLAGCVTAAPAFLPQTAHALPNEESVTTYYNNSAHTTVVGQKIVFCDGTVNQSGTVTAFFTERLFMCFKE
jgi:hypothetical protein